MKFTITVSRDEDGAYIAECPSIPGCVSQGKTEADAIKNVRKAIKECLQVRAKKACRLPFPPNRSREKSDARRA